MCTDLHPESGILVANQPDLLLFAADRHRFSSFAVLFPRVDLETMDFFRTLEADPTYLDARDIDLLYDEGRAKDVADASSAKLDMLRTQSGATEVTSDGHEKAESPLTQRMSHIKNLPLVLEYCQGRQEHYLSQNTFRYKNGIYRRVANVNQLTSLWVDLDYYKYADSDLCAILDDDGDAVDMILNLCITRHKTGRSLVPSLIVRSGRGLYVKWIFSHFLPAIAHPRWRACQDALVGIFESMYADKAARDAARVLRIVGSTNSKSHTPVKVIFKRKLHVFDDLAALILKQERLSAIDRQAVQSLTEKYKRDLAQRKRLRARPTAPKREWKGRQWSDIVATELPRLIDVIGPGIPMRGRMEGLCFVTMNYRLMSGKVSSEADFKAQVKELGRDMGADVEQLLSQVIGSWTRYAKGETPYRLNKSRILGLLALDPIVDKDILANFPWLLQGKGTINVKVNSSKADKEEVKQSARKLHAEGLSLKEIGTKLQTSPKTIKRWLVAATPSVDEKPQRSPSSSLQMPRSSLLNYSNLQQITYTGETI